MRALVLAWQPRVQTGTATALDRPPRRGMRKASQTVPIVLRGAWILVICLAPAGFMQGSLASAETEPSVALNDVAWQAPAACPDVSEIRSKVEALLGSTRAPRAPLTASATVSAQGAGFTAQIELRAPGTSESKTLHAADCATLGQAYALIVAFVLDPSATPSRLTAAEPEARAPSASSRDSAPPAPRRPRPRRYALGVGAVGALGVGQLPFPAFGIGGRLNAGRFAYGELGAMYWPPRHEPVATAEGEAGADVSLTTADSALCVPLAREALAACLGVSAGSMRAAGTGVSRPSIARSPWISGEVVLSSLVALSRGLALRFRLAAGVPFVRPRFVLNELGAEAETETAFRPSPVFGTFSIAPELRFFSTDWRRAGHATR